MFQFSRLTLPPSHRAMIENLRKYTGLIVVLFVLVIIGFIFMDTSTFRASSGGAPVIKIAGKSYSDKEYHKLGSASYEVTRALMEKDIQFYFFLLSLSGNAQSQDQAIENFFANRIILRSAKEEFGIYPADKEIDTFISQLRAFAGQDGEFSQEIYGNFVKKGIGHLGLTENDIRELATDLIIHDELMKILGTGLMGDRDMLAKSIALKNQTISLNLARIDLDPIEAKIDPTEDEIKAYWETIQDAFKTQEKRKFTYFVAKPEIPAEPAEIAPLAEGATDEMKAEHAKQVAEREASIIESLRVAQNDISDKVDEFLYKLETQDKLSFEKLAADEKWELISSDFFTPNDAPEALKATLRSARTQGTAVDILFQMKITSDPFSRISSAISVGENDFIIAHLDEIEESRTQTFEEARDEARARLISDKASAALKEAAEKATESIKTSLAEGKTFSEAAKAAGIENEVVPLLKVDNAYQPQPALAPANLFSAAQYTKPGELTKPVIESDRAFVIHVESSEVVKDEKANENINSSLEQATENNRYAAFSSWLNSRNEAAGIERLNR